MNQLRNSVQLLGRVGQDPELRTFEKGSTLLTFSLATNDYYKNKDGEKVQETQWHNIKAWGKTAEFLHQFVSKGSEILVQGKLMYRSYEDKGGEKKYISEIQVSEFLQLGKREVSS